MYTPLLAIHAKGCRRDPAPHPETIPISSFALRSRGGVDAPSPAAPAASELSVVQENKMSDRPRISAARRNAEALLSSAQKRESDFKLEQEPAARGRRWLSRRHASASFGLPKRKLIDPQSPLSQLLNRG